MSFREQFFGRQLVDSGTMSRVDLAGRVDPFYLPTNPLSFEPELGFMGARYLIDYAPVIPLYRRPGYGGVLPIAEQPKVNMPLTYREPVLF